MAPAELQATKNWESGQQIHGRLVGVKDTPAAELETAKSLYGVTHIRIDVFLEKQSTWGKSVGHEQFGT